MISLLDTLIFAIGFFLSSLKVYPSSVEKSAVRLMEILLYAICCFFLADFNICSLYLILSLLFLICVWCISPWVYSVWDSLGFLNLCDYFLFCFREVFDYYLLKYFFILFLFLLFFLNTIIPLLVHSMLP